MSTSYWGEIVQAGLYRPLTLLSFGLNEALSPSPLGFHLTNDILHGAASVSVLLIAASLGLSRAGSLAAALLFALHPAQSEAVNAIVGRADILAFLFTSGSLLLHLKGARPLWVGLTFFLALSSKESAAFALPLFLFAPSKRALAPLGAAVSAYAAARLAALGGLGISGREIGFLDNPVAAAGLGTRLLAAPVLVLDYARVVLWPWSLSADYSFDQIPVPTSPLDLRVILGVAIGLALVGLAVRFRVLLALLPLLGFLHILFPLGAIFAERFLYLPMLGVALGFGLLLSRPGSRTVLLAVVAALCLARVHARNGDWKDNETLFRRTVATSPRSARSHFLLGAELLEKRAFREAAESFEKGLSIYPHHIGARMSLGEALLEAGEAARAEEAFRSVLERAPGSEEARRAAKEAALASGREQARAGDFPAARASFERAIALDERDPTAWNHLGLVDEREGRLDEARRRYERALALDPDHVPALVNLGSVLLNAGELAAAEETYRRALGLANDSYEAYNGLGIALARQGRRDEAAEAFERAIALEPGLETARENLRQVR